MSLRSFRKPKDISHSSSGSQIGMSNRGEKRVTRANIPRNLNEAYSQLRRKDEQIESLQEHNEKTRIKLAAVKAELSKLQVLYTASENSTAAQLSKVNELKIQVQTLEALLNAGEAKIQQLELAGAQVQEPVHNDHISSHNNSTCSADNSTQTISSVVDNRSLNISFHHSCSSDDSSRATVSSLGVGTKDQLQRLAAAYERDAKDRAEKIRVGTKNELRELADTCQRDAKDHADHADTPSGKIMIYAFWSSDAVTIVTMFIKN